MQAQCVHSCNADTAKWSITLWDARHTAAPELEGRYLACLDMVNIEREADRDFKWWNRHFMTRDDPFTIAFLSFLLSTFPGCRIGAQVWIELDKPSDKSLAVGIILLLCFIT